MTIKALRGFIFALVIAAAFPAWSTPQRLNGSELWINPAESGWGLYIDHQGDTLFATLFVYGTDNQPHWYSASSLTGDGTYTGALFESTGTPWGMPFDQGTVSRRQVGSMTLQMRGGAGTLTYDVDGVRVSKEIVPFAFAANSLVGDYQGYMTQPASGPGGAVSDEVHLAINHTGSSFSMSTQGSVSGSCTYTGTSSQHGSLLDVTGTYSCRDAGSGSFTIADADLTIDGFTARFSGGRIADAANGRIEAVRLGPGGYGMTGWMTDLWVTPGESGWGFNMVGQGDKIFGTLFVYDENRRAKWYSMSDMYWLGIGRDPNERGTYQGIITESTGSWFGNASFDASAVTRRVAGSVSIKFVDRSHAELRIQFGLTQWVKSMVPFAMRMNDLSGTYQANIVTLMTSDTTAAAHMPLTVTDNGSTVVLSAAFPNDNACTYTGSRTQYGQRVGIVGTWTCNSNGTSGSFTIDDAEVTANGFTGFMTGMPGGLPNPVGHIGGSRTAP